ncbi:MAG: CofH family radical SAM protein [bacterium]
MLNTDKIKQKVLNGERLSFEDGVFLFNSTDIIELGQLAQVSLKNNLIKNKEAEKINNVYFINNHHLNLSNICEGKCKFCAYRREEKEEGAFNYTLESAKNHIATKINSNISEIHIVSALNPAYDITFYEELFEFCSKTLPNVHIQALTAVEIDYISKISNISTEETLTRLKKAGLGSIPGGGAEIFSERIREKTCPDKISGKSWLEIMTKAHKLGIQSNATMLCGIDETIEEKVEHILKIREVQDQTNGFMTFIPLFCHYDNTEISTEYELTGFDMLKTYAISRLLLDNVPHLKAFWIQTGIKLAQATLAFGVDDLDGTVVEEKITRFAGATTGQFIEKNELIRLIKNAGKKPLERDTVYNIIKEY